MTYNESYNDSLEDFRVVSSRYRSAAKAYRAGQIDDATFLAARKELDAAQQIVDKTESEVVLMARTVTPTYRVEARDNWGAQTSYVWRGRATQANLEKWRQEMNASFRPEGVNWHVSVKAGYIVRINSAKIVRQATGETVAETLAHTFEVA